MFQDAIEGKNLGKYQILEALGQGGMARVYRAYHPQLDRFVAIKVIRPDLITESEFLARFQREARAVAALRHPNIVQIFDFDVHQNIYYMVMELLEGDTLKARMNDYRIRGQIMPYGEIVRILLDTLKGLGYAHSQGMIHRDIKPANIMLTRDGQAVLADFGIVQIVGSTSHTATGALVGTLNYMAPEQGMEGKTDVRSDLYSLGVVFYEMLTGRPPFDADTPLAILMKHINDPLPLPSKLNPNIPSQFERIVLKALSKHPEDRYQSADEMAQALRDAAAETGISLPSKISQPFTFRTPDAPAEAVAVFSGAARPAGEEAEFAKDDTASFTQGQTAAPRTAPQAAAQANPAANTTPPAAFVTNPTNLGLTIVYLLVIWNAAALIISGAFNRWGIYVYGWPTEILILGLAFAMSVENLRKLALFIPAGVLVSIGTLLSYFSLFNTWSQWYLWLVEVLFIIFLSITTGRNLQREDHEALALRYGNELKLITVGVIILTALLAGFRHL
jgi:serine/threonine-protein kinase